MHTNKELMTSEQPLKAFPSTKNNNSKLRDFSRIILSETNFTGGKIIRKRYGTHKEFKEAYQLHQLRFAITPWIKSLGEKVFHRHSEEQYISEITIEDKNVKKL